MIEYYARRAAEYEQVYAKPERQADLQQLRKRCREIFAGRDLLEISCGTGYWTECFAESAARILATDINPETLEIARAKPWKEGKVEFAVADSLALPDFGRHFDAGFAGFWWSHVPLERLQEFLAGFHARLTPGATVAFMDNRYVAGSSTPIHRTDEAGNTYQPRKLADGSSHEVLKNFPDKEEIRAVLASFTDKVEVVELEYFWMAVYNLT
ncbi:class I SAM-dependent methyltransferase [Haloferula sp. BvORR071]|uniref:class I SAM-dependent methyltransferase n=1 Tax=Haloferula sp. BvORR071 TaxID=1396141 RepID=UPI0005596594|nr:class I SAM-dependent methyltransferase [Haloferula sp. BvORR071]